MLAARDIACERGGRVLFSGLSFSLQPGTLLHVQGVNGSGKTSLLRMLCGLGTPVAGCIVWNGEDIRDLREDFAAQMLYIGHQPAIKDDLTALENLELSQALAGQPVERAEALGALAQFKLNGHLHLPARALSQGQKRRVALARLWLSRMPLWVLDEPFTALDNEAGSLLEGQMEAHLGRGGMVVLTTHHALGITAEQFKVLRL